MLVNEDKAAVVVDVGGGEMSGRGLCKNETRKRYEVCLCACESAEM